MPLNGSKALNPSAGKWLLQFPNSTPDTGTKYWKITTSLKNSKLSLRNKSEELLYQKISMGTAQEISCFI